LPEDRRLVRLTRICLALPEATRDWGSIDWDEVEDFVTDSYALVAPKRLAALLEAPG